MKKSYREDVLKDIDRRAKGNKMDKEEISEMMKRVRSSKKLIDTDKKPIEKKGKK